MLVAGLVFLLTSGPSLNNLICHGAVRGHMAIGAFAQERGAAGQNFREHHSPGAGRGIFPAPLAFGGSVTAPDAGATFRVLLRPPSILAHTGLALAVVIMA